MKAYMLLHVTEIWEICWKFHIFDFEILRLLLVILSNEIISKIIIYKINFQKIFIIIICTVSI